jgi:hypothetical protein
MTPTTSPTHARAARSKAARLAAIAFMLAALVVIGIAVFGSGTASADPTPKSVAAQPAMEPIQLPARPGPAIPPTPPVTPPDDEEEPGLFDIPGQVRAAISGFFAWVAKTSLTPVMTTFGQTLLSTPDLTATPQVTAAWAGTLTVANALLVLFVLLGGITVMSRQTLQTQYGLKEIAPRIVIAGVAANASLLLIGKGIQAANAISTGIAGLGVDPKAAAKTMTDAVAEAAADANFLMSLLLLAVVVMAVVAMFMFILRVVVLVLLIGSAPIALMCHATPQTEELAYLWWRALFATFGIQIAQALVLLATVRVFLTPAGPTALGIPSSNDGLLGVLVCLAMLWLLIKLPGLARHLVLGPLMRKTGRGPISQVIHTVLLLKALNPAALLFKAASPNTTRRRPAPPRSGATARQRQINPPPPAIPTRPGPNRPSPTIPFSHPPTKHTPTPRPTGTTQPVFSHPAQTPTPPPSNPRPQPGGTTTPVFSTTNPRPKPAPPPNKPAPPAQFTNAPTRQSPPPTVTPAPAGPVPPTRFSNAPTPASPVPPLLFSGENPTPQPSAPVRLRTTPRHTTGPTRVVPTARPVRPESTDPDRPRRSDPR